jgi:hypothetical protein
MTWHAVALVAISALILWGAGLRFDCGITPSPYVRPYAMQANPRAPLQPRPTITTATAETTPALPQNPVTKRLPEPMLVESSVAMPFTDQPQF